MATDNTEATEEAHRATMVVMSANDAMAAMQAGEVPARLRVEGSLHFYHQYNVAPPHVLPADELVAENIIIHDASLLTQWPRIVRCHDLYLWNFWFDFSPESVIEQQAPADAQDGSAGELNLQNCPRVTRLPHMRGPLRDVRIDGCPLLEELPADLHTTMLEVRNCPQLSRLPDTLRATSVSLVGCTALTALPDDCVVTETLNLLACVKLTRLPDVVETLQLTIFNCRRLQALPLRLRSLYINMSGCTSLTRWDDPDVTALRQLSAQGCVRLESLPPHLRQIDELDVSGCTRLTRLPDELRVTQWVDVGASGVRALPASAQGAQVRWNGINVTGQVAFHPETLTVRQVSDEENAEVRRVMLERIGPGRLFAEAQPRELDADTDVGGVRRLLHIAILNDEPFVALEVRDPSTERLYLLRVPPTMHSCRQAAAWIAGFDDPDAYQPLLET